MLLIRCCPIWFLEGNSLAIILRSLFANLFMDDDLITIDWRQVADGPCRWADRWSYTLALYAVVHPDEGEILYLGKADGSTVRSRWDADDKHDRVWRRMEGELGLYEHSFIIGEFRTAVGARLTRKLVCDVESMLIHEIKPWANRQNTKSRGYSRPGLLVCCQGHWPLRRKTFRDNYAESLLAAN